MAESSEVKAFFREASNQKGRSESERIRRRKATIVGVAKPFGVRGDGYNPCGRNWGEHTRRLPAD